VYENYLKGKQIEWKGTVKEKKRKRKQKTENGIFSPGWLYQPEREVITLGLGLEPL